MFTKRGNSARAVVNTRQNVETIALPVETSLQQETRARTGLGLKRHASNNNCNLELPSEGSTMKREKLWKYVRRSSQILSHLDFRETRANPCLHAFCCALYNARFEQCHFEERGCAKPAIEKLRSLATRCVQEQQNNENAIMTKDDENNCEAARCHICGSELASAN